MSGYASTSDRGCRHLVEVYQMIQLFVFFCCASFLGLRAWTLSDRKKTITALVMMLCLTPILLTWAQYHWLSPRVHPVFGCINGSSIPTALARMMGIAGRATLITADVLVIVVTWHTTYRMGVLRRTKDWLRPSFWRILVRDGTFHCCTMLILNIIYLLSTIRAINSTSVNPVSYVTVFIEPATTVLCCRFLINVREVNKQAIRGLDPSSLEMPMYTPRTPLQLGKLPDLHSTDLSSFDSPTSNSPADVLPRLESGDHDWHADMIVLGALRRYPGS